MPNPTSHQRNSPWVLLRQQLTQTFSESEIKQLCFDLGVDFDELGQGIKTDKVINLIGLMQQDGRLVELLSAVATARSHLPWPALEALQSRVNEYPYPYTRPFIRLTREEQLAQRNRQTMLLKVKAYWVDGVLANSLHSKVIPLDMERNPGAVTRPRPWDMLWQVKDQQPQPLPPGTRIIDRFQYTAGEALLILGEPGSGKTTMLLELARDLLTQATQDESLRIPVVFNLSTWASKQPPLTDWLMAELQTLYLIPKKTAQTWVEQDDILPLLDGLDEVAEAHRVTCIQAINDYRAKQGTPLVVCSRTVDYEAMGRKLLLSDALILRPLTLNQINDYLLGGGPALEGVRQALHQDDTLLEMAQSPLLLSIMAIANRDQPPEQFTTTNLDDRRRQLFATYIQRQLPQRRKDPREDTATTLRQLTYLAHQMATREQTLFLIERLQPDWIPNLQQKRNYYWRVGLFGSLVGGLFGGLYGKLVNDTLRGLVSVQAVELVSELVGVAISESVYVSLWGLFFGVFTGLLVMVEKIEPVERVSWPWRYYLGSGLIGIPVTGLIFELITEPVNNLFNEFYGRGGLFSEMIDRLGGGLIIGLGAWLLGGLISGIKDSQVELKAELKATPNEGMKNSLHNALWFGLLGGLTGVVCSVLVYRLVDGAILWLFSGLLSGLWFGGGLAVFQHYSLRFLLHHYRLLPLNLVPFLDLAAERLILQKVGGGYRFVHRLLQDYLASLYVEEDP